jgi:MoxR-like ATPase
VTYTTKRGHVVHTVQYVELPSRAKLVSQLVQNIELGEPTFLLGDRGIGKTMLAHIAAQQMGRPLEVFHFSALFDAEAAITGALVLRDGSTRYVRSEFIRAVTRPRTIILADEINRAPGAALNALLSLLDFQARIVLDLEDEDQRVVQRAPGVVFLATANIGAGYVGVEPLDAALTDRMTVLRVGYPEDEDRLLTPHVSKRSARELVRLARVIRSGHENGNLPFTISTRRLVFASRLVALGVSVPEAFERNVAAFDADAVTALHTTLKAAA